MATLKELQAALRRLNQSMEKLDRDAPRVAGVEAIRWIHGNFDKESYRGVKWKARDKKTNKKYDSRSGVKGSVFNSGNKILYQTGNLRDSIRSRPVNRIAFVGFDTNRVPYGEVHNEGGRIMIGQKRRDIYFYKGKFAAPQKGRRRTKKSVIVRQTEIRMPKRQFMPRPNEPTDPELLAAVGKKLDFERQKIFSTFKK